MWSSEIQRDNVIEPLTVLSQRDLLKLCKLISIDSFSRQATLLIIEGAAAYLSATSTRNSMTRNNEDSLQLASHSDIPQSAQVQPTTSSGWAALPAETLYHILRFLEPQDLIRLQAVSKLFHVIICDAAVWRTTYSIVRLPLPPGPFPWQSLRFLQRVLVQSARLARAWTTEPFTLVSRRIFTGPRSIEDDRCRWVRGRWLITSKNMKQLRSRDIETGSEQVLWDHGPFAHWAATSVMNPVGHFIYVAVHLGKGRPSDSVKLLELVVDDDTGCFSGPEILDVPTWALQREAFVPQVRVDSGLAPYAYVSLSATNKPRQSLIFDPQHRRFYKFPRFRTQLDLLLNYRGAWLPHLVEVYFMQTHLLVLNRSYLIHGFIGNVEVIQIFSFPDVDPEANHELDRDSTSDGDKPIVRELRLTHETLSRDTGSLWLTPIRNSFVNPITRTTTLRFMHTYAPFQHDPESRARFVCTDYILPDAGPSSTRSITLEDIRSNSNVSDRRDDSDGLFDRSFSIIVPSTEQVLPITVESHDVLSVQGVWNGNLVDVSDDGFVRGLCVVNRYGEGSQVPNIGVVHKFAVDATGPRCVAIVGDPSPPWAGFETSRSYDYTFDGVGGKLWSIKGDVLQMDSTGQPEDRDILAIVSDFR